MASKIILIAGGSGLIGKELQKELQANGHEVRVLTRKKEVKAPYFYWNPTKKEINREAIKGVQVIINLCGAGIVDKRWTDKRKQELFYSRIRPAQYLHELSQNMPALTQYVSASGINCYGYSNPDKMYKESDPYGKDFLSAIVKDWEEEAELFSPQQKVAKVRTGSVLTKEGGALVKMSQTIKMFVGSPIGTGKQFMPWISMRDMVRLYAHIVEHQLEGTYNAFTDSITNRDLTKAIAKKLKRPVLPINVPSFVIKMVLGEMSILVLDGIKVDNTKIKATGFKFKDKTIECALDFIYNVK